MQPEVRRLFFVLSAATLFILGVIFNPSSYEPDHESDTYTPTSASTVEGAILARDLLDQLDIKGKAPRTGYARAEFGDGWGRLDGCDMRNIILARDLTNITLHEWQPGEPRDRACLVLTGTLNCPYTNTTIDFTRGVNSSAVQIDHVVALSNAWQTGAQNLTREERIAFSNDPLNLLATDGPANMQKADHDAAGWLPPNRAFRCHFIARQISIKHRHNLWVTSAERDTMIRILDTCPDQPAITE
ncbi:HNH endonuclease family protein [Candidatus Saccharibacteria bacterium]|nr:HNH endonuclease family protein [Candidatus Saccharibacteria bacterium]